MLVRISMSYFGKILVYLLVFTGLSTSTFADRGVGRKKKSVVQSNIKLSNSFNSNLSFNLSNGLKYKGSILKMSNSSNVGTANTAIRTNVLTFQKGNVVYLVPVKQKIQLQPDAARNYAGMKLIIKVP